MSIPSIHSIVFHSRKGNQLNLGVSDAICLTFRLQGSRGNLYDMIVIWKEIAIITKEISPLCIL